MEMVLCCVPVEIARHPGDASRRQPRGAPPATASRYFRLAFALSEELIRLRSAVPDELCGGPLLIRLQIPGEVEPSAEEEGAAEGPLTLTAVAEEVVVDQGEDSERAEHRVLRLCGTPEAARARLAGYVRRRLDSSGA